MIFRKGEFRISIGFWAYFQTNPYDVCFFLTRGQMHICWSNCSNHRSIYQQKCTFFQPHEFQFQNCKFCTFFAEFRVVEGGPPGPEFLGLWSWRSLRPLVWTTALQPRWALGLRVRVGFASVIAVASFVRICLSENTVPQNHSKSNCLLYLLSSFAHLTEL